MGYTDSGSVRTKVGVRGLRLRVSPDGVCAGVSSVPRSELFLLQRTAFRPILLQRSAFQGMVAFRVPTYFFISVPRSKVLVFHVRTYFRDFPSGGGGDGMGGPDLPPPPIKTCQRENPVFLHQRSAFQGLCALCVPVNFQISLFIFSYKNHEEKTARVVSVVSVLKQCSAFRPIFTLALRVPTFHQRSAFHDPPPGQARMYLNNQHNQFVTRLKLFRL